MSITRVVATNFKGLSFNQPLGERTLFVGPNGAGKSARSQALQLAVNGGVIGAGKTNDDILSTFGEGDKLVVGVEIDGKYLFERGFVRGPSGSVSQGYKAGGVKVSKDYFMKALGESGAPVVLNVADFMALSDQKKIEALFQLYPPAGDISAVQGNIDTAKEKINSLAAKVKTSEQAAARIASSKSQIQVPAGTLAEVDAQITSMEAELKEAQENLTQIRMEEQKVADALKAKEEADRKEKERIEAEEKAKVSAVSDEAILASLTERPGEMEKKANALFGPEKITTPTELAFKFSSKDSNLLPPVNSGLWKAEAVINSIQIIIDAMDEAGCESCVSGDKIVCLLCGRSYRRIGTHLLSIHQVTPNQYREMYKIPWTYGLLCADSEKLYSDSAKKSGLGQNVDLQEISSLRKSAPVRMCPFKKEIARENVSKVPKRLRVFDAGVTKRGTSEFHERMKNRPQVAASIERLKTYWKGKKQDPEHIKKRISKMLSTKAALKLGKT